MIRRLLLVVVVGLVVWLIRSLRRAKPAPKAAPRPRARGRGGEPMVRDRVCNTYLPRGRAVVLTRDGQDHFFCSDACQSEFLAQLEPPA